jgi:hypothetical protein
MMIRGGCNGLIVDCLSLLIFVLAVLSLQISANKELSSWFET